MFPKERLLIISFTMIVLLCIPLVALSLSSPTVSIPSYGRINVPGREYPPSTFTYRIFQNSTSAYRINSAGFVDDSNRDPVVVINDAMWSCSEAGGGSIYVMPNTYSTGSPIGGDPLYNHDFSNIYLMLGGGTVIQRTSGDGDSDALVMLQNVAGGSTHSTNFTLTSNGTATFDAKGLCNGAWFRGWFNFTLSHIVFQHLYAQGLSFSQMRYLTVDNCTVFSYDEGKQEGSIVGLGDVQYSTFKNLNLDGQGEYVDESRITMEGFYIGDWDGDEFWDGTYFNTFTGVFVHNMRRNGFYLNGGATGYGVHNNTFSNCTVEGIWQDGYFGIKLRPSQNNTFTNIVIQNCAGGVTTGTSYDYNEVWGNTTGNYVQATLDNIWSQPFTLTTDGSGQSVYNNIFNLTFSKSAATYFASSTNSVIHDNVCYVNFTNCEGGLYFESGYIQNNKFYCSFSNSATATQADIWFYNDPNFDNHIVGNNMYVYAHGTNTFLRFTNGTYNNRVYYPYSG